jgi:uncharacterized protein YdeI (YjbR/CyaY-like superfamily)
VSAAKRGKSEASKPIEPPKPSAPRSKSAAPPRAEPEPRYFRSPAEFRRWLQKHHDSADELWVGFHKRATGKPSLTWPESVDEALCVGWIDGIRKRVDDERYKIRFTPRRKGSVWSAINIRRVGELEGERRMQPAGRAAFDLRKENRSGIYAYEQRTAEIPEPYAAELRANPKAAAFFEAQPAWYRKQASWWVVSAKKEETRRKRLATLIARYQAGRRH